MWMQKIEDWHNWASETDFVWFPFRRLKPKPDQLISLSDCLKMAFLFGPFYSLYNFLRVCIFGRTMDLKELALSMLIFTLFFFVWFNLVTANLWNRRARRLQAQKANRQASA